ncbi:MAG: PepSY-associated TM helix domain-containing protein [Chitinophagaceae bacterium]
MRFKKIIGKIHLWLGLASGLIVLFLGITGCILAFENEIRSLTQPYWFVKEENKPLLPPTQLKQLAEKHLDGKKANSVEYGEAGRSATVMYYDADNYKMLFLNPYNGDVLKVVNMNRDFFRVVVNGHFYLWLPPKIGQPIVASATLIFFIMLITGIILWWPKNRAARKQRFSVKWNAKWKRVNYDLHNVFGFYMTWVVIFIVITGLVWGFEWFEKSVYWVSSGGKEMPAYYSPPSDTLQMAKSNAGVTDNVWQNMLPKKKTKESLSVSFPSSNDASLDVSINHKPGTYYNMDNYYFDQYTGKELKSKGTYAGAFANASVADKIKRMNYDIHVGAVLGLPGKIMAFFASLIAASLPVTGFYIWWGRKKKKKSAVTVSEKVTDKKLRLT